MTIELDQYDVSPERGFLSPYPPQQTILPPNFDPLEQMGAALPDLLVSNKVRAQLQKLPLLDIETLEDDAARRRAMVHYSFLIQAYVWGEAEAPRTIPACIAQPIWGLAAALGQKPLLLYSGYVLDNWDFLPGASEIDLDSLMMTQNFLAGMDEAWFVLIHVAIEAKAGGIIAEMPRVLKAADEEDISSLTSAISRIGKIWDEINAIFDRMPEKCDPYIYFNRVRPFIHGWQDNPALPNGLIYEGVEATNGKPVTFRGQTGSQSSIVPMMDALLGLTHADDPLRRYLNELHDYRPPSHRKLIDDVRAQSGVRAFAEKADNANLRDAYNYILDGIVGFRSRHLEYAASYINKQGKKNEGNHTEVGTGGTPFMRYLKKHRDESSSQKLGAA